MMSQRKNYTNYMRKVFLNFIFTIDIKLCIILHLMKENESLDPVTAGTFGMNRVMLDPLNPANFK